MKNATLWIVAGAIALLVLGFLGGMYMPVGWNNARYGFACPQGWNSYGMMGRGGWGMMPFGFFGMFLAWLIPLGTVTLIVGGIFWLVRSLTKKQDDIPSQ